MKHNWLALILAIACPVSLVAQSATPTQKPPEDPDNRDAKQIHEDLKRSEAINLVERTAAEAPLWNDKKAAVRVLADAADLLWNRTPALGEKRLRKAWELIDRVSDSPRDEKLKEFFTRSDQTDLRTAVLVVARKYDPELVDKFLKQLSQKEPVEKKGRGAFDDRTSRSEQLLQMAQQAIDTNPEVAFSLAERSLVDGLSYSLQNVLTGLRNKDVALANRLFDLALAHFSSGAPDPSEAEVLAGYLFQSGFTFSTNSTGQIILAVNPAQQNLPAVAPKEPQRARNFLIAFYQVLLARPLSVDTPEDKQRGQRILILGKRLAGLYNEFAPEFVQPALGFLTQLQRQLFPNDDTGQFGGSTGPRTAGENTTKRLTNEEIYEKHLAELEEKADKENNPIAKKVAYVEAALAAKSEDYHRAKRIAEKIDDEELRTDAVSFVLYRAALFFAQRGELEKAIEMALQINNVSRRAVVEIAIAQHLLARKSNKTESGDLSLEQQHVFDLLSDIERDLKKEGPSATAVKIMLGRTAVLAELDIDQALTSLTEAVQMINKLNTFDLLDRAAPNLGLGGFTTSGSTVAGPRIGFDFRSAIDPLIGADFEQVSAISERFTATELRGVARLEAAKLYLKQNNVSATRESSRAVR